MPPIPSIDARLECPVHLQTSTKPDWPVRLNERRLDKNAVKGEEEWPVSPARPGPNRPRDDIRTDAQFRCPHGFVTVPPGGTASHWEPASHQLAGLTTM